MLVNEFIYQDHFGQLHAGVDEKGNIFVYLEDLCNLFGLNLEEQIAFLGASDLVSGLSSNQQADELGIIQDVPLLKVETIEPWLEATELHASKRLRGMLQNLGKHITERLIISLQTWDDLPHLTMDRLIIANYRLQQLWKDGVPVKLTPLEIPAFSSPRRIYLLNEEHEMVAWINPAHEGAVDTTKIRGTLERWVLEDEKVVDYALVAGKETADSISINVFRKCLIEVFSPYFSLLSSQELNCTFSAGSSGQWDVLLEINWKLFPQEDMPDVMAMALVQLSLLVVPQEKTEAPLDKMTFVHSIGKALEQTFAESEFFPISTPLSFELLVRDGVFEVKHLERIVKVEIILPGEFNPLNPVPRLRRQLIDLADLVFREVDGLLTTLHKLEISS